MHEGFLIIFLPIIDKLDDHKKHILIIIYIDKGLEKYVVKVCFTCTSENVTSYLIIAQDKEVKRFQLKGPKYRPPSTINRRCLNFWMSTTAYNQRSASVQSNKYGSQVCTFHFCSSFGYLIILCFNRNCDLFLLFTYWYSIILWNFILKSN
jgi:hypothetical protein